MSDLTDTISKREATYGGFDKVATTAQNLKQAFYEGIALGQTGGKFNDPQKESLDMILHKLARIACGDPHYKDNWHDIAGYALLGEKYCEDNLDTSDITNA